MLRRLIIIYFIINRVLKISISEIDFYNNIILNNEIKRYNLQEINYIIIIIIKIIKIDKKNVN